MDDTASTTDQKQGSDDIASSAMTEHLFWGTPLEEALWKQRARAWLQEYARRFSAARVVILSPTLEVVATEVRGVEVLPLQYD